MATDSPITAHPWEPEAPAGAGNPRGPAPAFGSTPLPPPAGATGAFGDWVPTPPYPAADYPVEPTAPKGRRPRSTWLAAGLAAAVFGVGGFFGIQAVTHHTHATTTAGGFGGGPGGGFPGGGQGPGAGGGFPGDRGTMGTISAINGSSFTVTSFDGSTATVTTSSATTVTKATAGSLSDIHTGDHVVVGGTSATGGIAATRVTDSGSSTTAVAGPGGPPGGNGTTITGNVASVGSGTFEVAETGGTMVTVTTSSSTNVTVIQPSSVSALAVGDTVRVTGTVTNSTVAATTIESGTRAGRAGFGGPGAPPARP